MHLLILFKIYNFCATIVIYMPVCLSIYTYTYIILIDKHSR